VFRLFRRQQLEKFLPGLDPRSSTSGTSCGWARCRSTAISRWTSRAVPTRAMGAWNGASSPANGV